MNFDTKIVEFVEQRECTFMNSFPTKSITSYAEVYIQVTHRYSGNFCNLSLLCNTCFNCYINIIVTFLLEIYIFAMSLLYVYTTMTS